MSEVITIGVDLAKNVFQVHGVDAEGAVVVRRQLRRGQGRCMRESIGAGTARKRYGKVALARPLSGIGMTLRTDLHSRASCTEIGICLESPVDVRS